MRAFVEELEALVLSIVGDASGVDVEMTARALQAYMSDAAKLLLATPDRFHSTDWWRSVRERSMRAD